MNPLKRVEPVEPATEKQNRLKRAGRAIVIIRIAMGLFILIPLILVWWLGFLRF
jgi:hypothetical protein